MKILVPVEFKLPSLPNFVRSESGASIDVADLTEEQLRGIGRAWADELVRHAHRRREQREMLDRIDGAARRTTR